MKGFVYKMNWNNYKDKCVEEFNTVPPDFYAHMQKMYERDLQERLEYEQKVANAIQEAEELSLQQLPIMANHYTTQYSLDETEVVNQELSYCRPYKKYILGMILFVVLGVYVFVNFVLWLSMP